MSLEIRSVMNFIVDIYSTPRIGLKLAHNKILRKI